MKQRKGIAQQHVKFIQKSLLNTLLCSLAIVFFTSSISLAEYSLDEITRLVKDGDERNKMPISDFRIPLILIHGLHGTEPEHDKDLLPLFL